MAENTNDSQVVETEEELTNYTTETNAGAGTGTSAIEPGYGTGRRKEAVARVRLVPGDGKWTINGRTLEEYFPSKLLQREVNSPIVLLKLEGKFDAIVLVDGGGTTGQAGAIRLGVARALNATKALRGIPRRAFVFVSRCLECDSHLLHQRDAQRRHGPDIVVDGSVRCIIHRGIGHIS